ncbi:MAG TPA: TolC family protein [Terracidiphilus sp.]|nr:TolC family protein [Terracidiphilus sp.]
MSVSRSLQSARRPRRLPALFALLWAAPLALAQYANPTSAANPFYGSITVAPVTGETIQLSLDDAIQRGLKTNLGLQEAQNSARAIHAEQMQALQEFLPTISLTGDTGFYQHDLAALGFSASTFNKFAGLFPPGVKPNFPLVTKDTLTEGQVHYEQTLFSGPVIAGWRAAGAATRASHFAVNTARGDVVQNVASTYLQSIAASSDVENAKALEQADLVQLNHTRDQHEAGVASNLDEVRARVQYQTQQQAVLAAQNDLDKDLILLKREIGLSPGQDLVLTDHTPYNDLALQTPEEVRASAFRYRNDYQNLQNQVQELKAIHAAYRSQRWPKLSFSGNYGVEAIGGVLSHGTFAAIGTLSVPVFREAGLRGDIDASQAQLNAVESQLDDLRGKIDQQVRTALLDVAAANKLVEVSRSNVDLATRGLSDETDRVNAGVDDTLPLVTAQAALAAAQRNLVQSLYAYNVSKLALARAAGVLELQYRDYIGR